MRPYSYIFAAIEALSNWARPGQRPRVTVPGKHQGKYSKKTRKEVSKRERKRRKALRLYNANKRRRKHPK